ncbi:MAG: hypothetical protein ABIH20_01785 [Candidatus Diapherotrites archaeon]
MGKWKGSKKDRHQLTVEDRRKGGQATTERKKKANAMRSLKTGKYAKTLEGFEFCDSCPYKNSCMAYKPGRACPLRHEILKQMNLIVGPDGAQAWLNVVLRSMQDLFILSKTAPDPRLAMERYVKLWLEFGKIMFPQRIKISGEDKEIKVIFGEEDEDDSSED